MFPDIPISVFVSIILIKFFSIQVIFNDSYKNQILAKTKTYKAIQGDRGRIYDRNNEILAVETKKCTFWTNSIESSEEDRKDIVELFSKEFPESKILYKSGPLRIGLSWGSSLTCARSNQW